MTDRTVRPMTRRDLLLTFAPGCAALLAGGVVLADESLPHLEENDPLAKGLGYVHDAKKVDPKANPMYKAGSICANCAQIQGKPGDTWRPCVIFPGKLVNANGWCKVWAPIPEP